MPMWMMLVGIAFYGDHPQPRQWLGAALSAVGVLTVLTRGELSTLLTLRLVPGDGWILLAALSWALYSWQLARPPASLAGTARPAWTWSEALLVQVGFGLLWAVAAAALEALFGGAPSNAVAPVSWPVLAAAVLFLGVGPSVLAYRCWGAGVAATGPATASFFANLTPLFAALMSAVLLAEPPRAFHALAFAFIVGGIFLSSRR
jgi:drug/metabolite transporter (DMT)-like permease